MRKVTAGLFYSVDGVAEAPDQFQFDSFDNELGALLGSVMNDVDTVLLGRKGWQEWAGFWPNAGQDMDFAGFINAVPKHVASHTLKPDDLAIWQNSSLIEGDVEDFKIFLSRVLICLPRLALFLCRQLPLCAAVGPQDEDHRET